MVGHQWYHSISSKFCYIGMQKTWTHIIKKWIINLKLIQTMWRKYASVNYVTIGLDNDLSPIWHQTIV